MEIPSFRDPDDDDRVTALMLPFYYAALERLLRIMIVVGTCWCIEQRGREMQIAVERAKATDRWCDET